MMPTKMASAKKGLQTINRLLLSVVGQPRSGLEIKKSPLVDDYSISKTRGKGSL